MKLEIERRSRRLEYEENFPSRRRVTLEHLPSRKEKRKCITQLENQVKVTIWSDHKVWSNDKLKIKRKGRYRAGSRGAINWSVIKQIKFECCCKPNWLKKKLRLTLQMNFVAIILLIYVDQVSIDMELETRGIIGYRDAPVPVRIDSNCGSWLETDSKPTRTGVGACLIG